MTTACALLVAAAIATGAAVSSASAATAAPTANPTVEPNPASPGTQVWVYDANKCTAHSGTATSPALAAPITLAPLAHMTGGRGTLRQGLAAGTYTITLHCGRTLTVALHVSTRNTPAHSPTTPAGAAAAGDGSAEDHLGVGDAAVGSAFLLGGIVFATASFIRRRRATPRR